MTAMNWPDILHKLAAGHDLDADATAAVMATIVAGEATDAQIAAFAMALKCKGETAAEVRGLVAGLLEVAVPLEIEAPALDIVGTGGDQHHSVNLSTISSLIAAGAGATVVKHGNRAASSRCGSADVLEYLGVAIDMPAPAVAACVEQIGIGFCFAPIFHPAFRFAGPARKQMGIPTVFNILGPLANPAQPQASLIGAADLRLAPVMAEVFQAAQRRAIVVRGLDGLDEFTVNADNQVWDVSTGAEILELQLSAADVALDTGPISDLRGGDIATNAAVVTEILAGNTHGALATVRAAALFNAAAALVVYDQACDGDVFGFVGDTLPVRISQALTVATESVDSGAAALKLQAWQRFSATVMPSV